MEDRLDSYFADSDSGEPPVTKPFWNSLPEKVVSSSTVKNFKVRLDRFWAHEEIYNYKTIKPIYHAPEVEVIMTLN